MAHIEFIDDTYVGLVEKDEQATIYYEGKMLVLPTKELIRILEEYTASLSGGLSAPT